jgi:hypothetical protein
LRKTLWLFPKGLVIGKSTNLTEPKFYER